VCVCVCVCVFPDDSSRRFPFKLSLIPTQKEDKTLTMARHLAFVKNPLFEVSLIFVFIRFYTLFFFLINKMANKN